MPSTATKNAATRRRRSPNHDWKIPWLKAYIKHGTINRACRAVGVHRTTVFRARNDDEKFAQICSDIEEGIVDEIEHTGMQRAMLQSDRLIEFFLKAKRPLTYRDNVRVEHTGPDGGPIGHVHLHAEVEPERPSRVAELLSGQGYVDSTAVELSDNQNGNGKVG